MLAQKYGSCSGMSKSIFTVNESIDFEITISAGRGRCKTVDNC